ncbi:MAG: PPOX class F420-dependent oxidoreductase [Chloroflexi bacterium]|nr:PPOX class F420-dependent oxidoreductase [Chloroflexota bacterium]
MSEATVFPQLQGHTYISLTTFRKSGEGVATPVWFANDGDRLFIVTPQNSGKVKRIRNNPRVTLAPSDAQGKVSPGAPLIAGMASIVPMEVGGRGDRALRSKYGWMYRAFAWLWRIRRIEPVLLELRPA